MKLLRYLTLTLLLSIPLLGMLGRQLYILSEGAEVALEIVPVDPRSLFRGDYVRLDYAISTLQLAALNGEDDFSLHDEIHVILVPENDLYVAKAVFHQRPTVSDGQVVIKGRVSSVLESPWSMGELKMIPIPARLSVDYAIESYFVPEGTGRELESQASSGEVIVLAAVSDSGNAAIKGLRVNGSNHYIGVL